MFEHTLTIVCTTLSKQKAIIIETKVFSKIPQFQMCKAKEHSKIKWGASSKSISAIVSIRHHGETLLPEIAISK